MATDRYVDHEEGANLVSRDGLANGLVIMTTLCLLVAIYFVNTAMKKHFDTGLFGKSKVPNLAAAAAYEEADKAPPAK
jgi:hypothetical protein